MSSCIITTTLRYASCSASLLMHRQHSCGEPIINISYDLWRHRIVDIRPQGAILHNLWKFHRDRLSRLREKYYQHLCDNNNNADIPRGFALHIRSLPRHKYITITSVTFHQLNQKLLSARRSKVEAKIMITVKYVLALSSKQCNRTFLGRLLKSPAITLDLTHHHIAEPLNHMPMLILCMKLA